MKHVTAMVAAMALVLVAAGCSGGPSKNERDEFQKLVVERQEAYPLIMLPSVPTSIQEYVLGGQGIARADYIVSGSFTGGRLLSGPADTNLGTSILYGDFRLHKSLKGTVPSEFEVNLGTTSGGFDASDAMRGAGDVVLFLSFDAVTGEWSLVDDQYALARSDGGSLSMPFVPASMESQYLTGVVDVADVEALVIAGNLDPNGTLTGETDTTGGGVGGPDNYQDMIDEAYEIAND